MARRYVKVVGLLVVLLGLLALTVVAAQAKAGTGLGLSVLKLVAGHEEGARLSQAPAMNDPSDDGCGMSCGEQETGAAAQDMDCGALGPAEMDCGTVDAAETDSEAMDMSPTPSTLGTAETDSGTGVAVEKHCGPMDMGPDCGGELGCGVEAEADKS